MRIRKVFESIEFYEKIRTWHEGRKNLRVINNNERTDIINMFQDLKKSTNSMSKIKFISGVNKVDIDILTDDDEWYFVRFIHNNKHEYFKCDQKEGLIECIKRELIDTYIDI